MLRYESTVMSMAFGKRSGEWMIPKRVEEAINKQINAELYSAYLYFSIE